MALAFAPQIVDVHTGDSFALVTEKSRAVSMVKDGQYWFMLSVQLAESAKATDGMRIQVGRDTRPGFSGQARLFDPRSGFSWCGEWESGADGLLLRFPTATTDVWLRPLPETSLSNLPEGTQIEAFGFMPLMA